MIAKYVPDANDGLVNSSIAETPTVININPLTRYLIKPYLRFLLLHNLQRAPVGVCCCGFSLSCLLFWKQLRCGRCAWCCVFELGSAVLGRKYCVLNFASAFQAIRHANSPYVTVFYPLRLFKNMRFFLTRERYM